MSGDGREMKRPAREAWCRLRCPTGVGDVGRSWAGLEPAREARRDRGAAGSARSAHGGVLAAYPGQPNVSRTAETAGFG